MAEKGSLEGLINAIGTYEKVDREIAKTAAAVLNGCLQLHGDSTIEITLWSKGIIRKIDDFYTIYSPLLVQILGDIGRDYLDNTELQSVIRKRLIGGEHLLEKNKLEKFIDYFGESLLQVRREDSMDLFAKIDDLELGIPKTIESYTVYYSKLSRGKATSKLREFLNHQVMPTVLKTIFTQKGLREKLELADISEEDQILAYYFAFTNRIKYSVSKALESFEEYKPRGSFDEQVNFIRKLLGERGMQKQFRNKLPRNLDFGPKDPKGIYAPRQRASVIGLLKVYSEYMSLGWFSKNNSKKGIKPWETKYSNIWSWGEDSKQTLFNRLDVDNGYIFETNSRHQDTKIRRASKVIYHSDINLMNREYLTNRLKVPDEKLQEVYLLSYVTKNDSSILPFDGKTKTEKVNSHLLLLEKVIGNCKLSGRERVLLDGYLRGENIDVLGKSIDNNKYFVTKVIDLIKNKIFLSLIIKYRSAFEQGISTESIEQEELEKISNAQHISMDRGYRLRLATRIKAAAKNKEMSVKEYYKYPRKRIEYLGEQHLMMFGGSRKDMFSFAFQREF